MHPNILLLFRLMPCFMYSFEQISSIQMKFRMDWKGWSRKACKNAWIFCIFFFSNWFKITLCTYAVLWWVCLCFFLVKISCRPIQYVRFLFRYMYVFKVKPEIILMVAPLTLLVLNIVTGFIIVLFIIHYEHV